MKPELEPTADDLLEIEIEQAYASALGAITPEEKDRYLTKMSELCDSRSVEKKQQMEDEKMYRIKVLKK